MFQFADLAGKNSAFATIDYSMTPPWVFVGSQVTLGEIGLAGAGHDALAALFFCHVPRVALNVIDGRVIVRDGELTTLDLPRHVELHNRLARQLVAR